MHVSFFKTYLILTLTTLFMGCEREPSTSKPNVLLIMVDDLNDNIGVLGGHPQSKTPHLDQFSLTASVFTNAHTAAPMCGPSRASLFSGIYPHHSQNYFQEPWFNFPVLSNSRMLMEQFKMAGYNVIGTGKVLHHNKKDLWTHFENEADYTPAAFDGEKQIPHPDVPEPFSDIGWVDGSFGPLKNIEDKKTKDGKPLSWVTGNKKNGFKNLRYDSENDRDLTPDEINASWAAQKLSSMAEEKNAEPFFMAVGFLRPHTPLIAPQNYFDLFPIEEIQLISIKENDQEDTHLEAAYKGDVFTLKIGKQMFDAISQSYENSEIGLKKWTQAYLACVAAVDYNIGQVLEAIDNSSLKENTIVVIASDHGFHMGEKKYLYKNSLWDESTRVPLMVRAPELSKEGSQIADAVSLIDIYPTLLDLCNIRLDNRKSPDGRNLDGTSLKPLLLHNEWNGPESVLSVVFAGNEFKNNPSKQHYAIRSNRYRYILYNNGLEELYDHKTDPNEWVNLASSKISLLTDMRKKLEDKVAPVVLDGFTKTRY